MSSLKFKTNIKCSGCKSAVAPFLDKDTNITKWHVDLAEPNRVLTVEGDNIKSDEIIKLITAAGYTIEQL